MRDEAAVVYECDVLVIGSGVSGYCAAIAAGRGGCRVVLAEKDEVLGGNSGPNLGVGITGADRYNAHASETGLVHELQEEAAWRGGFTHISAGTMPYNIHRLNEAVVQEHLARAGVRVLKRHYAREPIMDGARIAGVVLEDLGAMRTVEVRVAGVVVEASGDGHIGALAGAEFDVGTEGRDEFGERSAPAERSHHVQGTSLVAIAHDTGRDVVFVPPADIPPFEPRLWHGGVGGRLRHHDGMFRGEKRMMFLYVTETGGHRDTIADDADIYETLLGQLWAEWDHIKNGAHADESRTWDLLWVSPKAGKRESRRFLGDVVLTQTDVEDGRLWPDDVAYGGHDLDDHQPLGESANIMGVSVPPVYGIPWRACYSRNRPNLLLGGRLISATHLAHSSTRIMRTGGAIGQAVGAAAVLCCRHGCSARELHDLHLAELQAMLLRDDAGLIGRPVVDEADLAPSATVTASSELCFNDQTPGQRVPLLRAAGNLLWDWPATLDSVEVFVHNPTDREQKLTLRVLRARRERKWRSVDEYHATGWNDLSDAEFAETGHATADAPAGLEGWLPVAFEGGVSLGAKDPASDADCVIVGLDANSDLLWAVTAPNEIGRLVEHRDLPPKWRMLGGLGAMRLGPAPGLGEAAQAVDGFNRRFSRGPTHMWISDPAAGLPQDLTLTWPEPVRIGRVEIAFDNLPASRHDNPWESGARAWAKLVRAYAVDVRDGDQWREVAADDANHHRVCRHAITPVGTTALRLRVLATHDGRSEARVYRVAVSGPSA